MQRECSKIVFLLFLFHILISRTIFEFIGNLDELTIIGYEDYSAFLTSSIRNLLDKKIKQANLKIGVNHNTINKDGKLSKDVGTIKKNVLIIVPIVSSFSTSIKIQNQLIEIFKSNKNFRYKNEYNIVSPTLNIILVGHKEKDGDNYKSFEKMATENIEKEKEETYYIYKDSFLNKMYNWHSINIINKIIRIQTFINEDILVKQMYYIPVYTKWHNADDCQLCYSDTISLEKCLIETGKASITPTLIFGYPKTKIANKYGLNTLNFKESLLYGNIKKGNNHYIYFTPTGNLVKNNIENIITWLKTLRDQIFNSKLIEYKKVVLVTPVTGSKSNFIDLVNEYVFEYTANCISVSLEEDYIENAESLYDDGLYQADIVIFVDDVLSTIKSFLDTDYIIKFILKKIHTGKGIDFCISLINRMTYDSEDNLLLKLPKNVYPILEPEDRLFYFTKINNPSIEEPNSEFPLTKEMNRYEYLANTSSLDGTRELFLSKIIKLQPIDIENNVPDIIKDHLSHYNKKLFQFLVINQFYSLFEINKIDEIRKDNFQNSRKINIDNYFKEDIDSFASLEKKILGTLLKDNNHVDIIKLYTHNLKYIILKIMCGSPLVYYQDIRKSAFYWIIVELEFLRCEMDKLNADTIQSYFSVNSENYYSKFQQFKFLLKRSVQLKSNYIIHKDFFLSIGKFIDQICINYGKLQDLNSINIDVFNQLITLFNTTDYSPGKVLIYNYLKEFNHLFREEYLKFISTISVIVINEESKKYTTFLLYDTDDKIKGAFDKVFNNIKLSEKFNIISPKKLIYHLIALIQELINEHETKAIRLEKNINFFIKDELDNTNGNFNHYLRLLKLENTAIIERFWEYFKNKESINCSIKIDINHFDNTLNKYYNDPKYLPIIQNLESSCELSFASYIKLQSTLYNWSIKEHENNDETDLNTKVSLLLMILSEIIGNVNSIYLNVNYNSLNNPPTDQLYTFEYLSDKNYKYSNIFNNQEKLNQSLSYRLLCGVKDDDYTLSNLEIFRNFNGLQIRSGVFNLAEIEKFTEIIALRDVKEYNILVVRLSDLIDRNGQSLYSNAVLTFILNRGQRVDVSKLRLVLLLRKYLSEFIKVETSKNTFLELLKNKERDDYQSKLRHGLGDYFMYQNSIMHSNNYSETNMIILEAINGAIKGQMGSYEPQSSLKQYSSDTIKKRIIAILESNLIEGKKVTSNNYSITFTNIREITIHASIYDVVVLELLINAKRHSPNINAKINVLIDNESISISNNIKKDITVDNRGRDGVNMCSSICKKLSYELKVTQTDQYSVIIKFPKNEESFSN